MLDFNDNLLGIGDIVAVTPKNYRGLVRAKVIAFTPKQVRVEYINNWNYGRPGVKEQYLVPPGAVIQLESPDV